MENTGEISTPKRPQNWYPENSCFLYTLERYNLVANRFCFAFVSLGPKFALIFLEFFE